MPWNFLELGENNETLIQMVIEPVLEFLGIPWKFMELGENNGILIQMVVAPLSEFLGILEFLRIR